MPELQRLLAAQAEETTVHQRLAEQPDRAVLQVAVEVDQHVPARHQVHFGKHGVGGQAVVGEHHSDSDAVPPAAR
ncbi:hypothetical protein G6F35_018475 [Rhizopus arrhizus]|nr:hypothetical protein G6F35_018475 [Rhizopus arrhizus]